MRSILFTATLASVPGLAAWQVGPFPRPAGRHRAAHPVAALDNLLPQLGDLAAQITEAFARLPATTEAFTAAATAGDAAGAIEAAVSGPELPATAAAVTAAGVAVADAQMPPPPTELLKGTILDGRELRLAYKASRDGWGARNFHDKVDFLGPAVVVAATRGAVFGGFNPAGWSSTDDYYGSTNAFLFVQGGGAWIKLRKIGGGEAAIFDYARSGPTFGSSELVIGATQAAVMGGFTGPDTEDMSAAGSLRRATSRLGLSYERGPPPFRASVFGGSRLDATLREVEVYVAKEGKKRAPFRTSRI